MLTKEIKQTIKDKISPLLGKTLEEISKENGINIYTIDLSDFSKDMGGEVSGLIRLSDNGYAIFIHSLDADTRKRFTLAHELGHYFLHRDILDNEKFILDLKDVILCRISKNSDDIKEQEANFFAAELLMPEDSIKQARSLNDNISEIAKNFFVSPLAVTNRLINLGLINNE